MITIEYWTNEVTYNMLTSTAHCRLSKNSNPNSKYTVEIPISDGTPVEIAEWVDEIISCSPNKNPYNCVQITKVIE